MNYISIKLLKRRDKGRRERKTTEPQRPTVRTVPFLAPSPQALAIPGSKPQAAGSDLESSGQTQAWEGGVPATAAVDEARQPACIWLREGDAGTSTC